MLLCSLFFNLRFNHWNPRQVQWINEPFNKCVSIIIQCKFLRIQIDIYTHISNENSIISIVIDFQRGNVTRAKRSRYKYSIRSKEQTYASRLLRLFVSKVKSMKKSFTPPRGYRLNDREKNGKQKLEIRSFVKLEILFHGVSSWYYHYCYNINIVAIITKGQ